MTIVERVNERKELMGINFVADGETKVIRSDGLSIMFMLKYQEIQKYIEHNGIQYKGNLAAETQRRTMQWISVYAVNERVAKIEKYYRGKYE